MKQVTPTELRGDLYNLLDEVLDTGIPLEINRGGKRLRILPLEEPNKLKNLVHRPGVIIGDPEELVSINWEGEIYLDTPIVVWLYSGLIEKLSPLAQSLINNNDLAYSPIVRLEIKYLLEIERITESPETILTNLEAHLGLSRCTKNFDKVVYQALELEWIRDPFDRLITAQSALSNNILLTKDKKILANYPHAPWS